MFERPASGRRLLLGLLLFGLLFVDQHIKASPDGFTAGDIFVSLSNGDVQWRHPDGSINQILHSGDGPAKNMAFDAQGNLYVPHWLSSSGTAGNLVAKFDNSGQLTGVFGGGYDCNPTSIQFDASGNAYVGQADCGGDILKFDSGGNLIARFDVAIENRGSGWIALASDQCTIYYTSAGPSIFRYNACTSTQLIPVNSVPLPGADGARGIVLLPDGGVLVADSQEILRLDSAGNVVAHYDAAARDCWYSLNLDPSGTSFWAADYCTAEVYKFDLALGFIQGMFVADTTGPLVKNVIVFKGLPAPPPPPSPPPQPPPPPVPPPTPSPEIGCCRITGGGSVFTTSGMRVTHGFELRVPASDPRQNLEVNWNPAGKGEENFHLTALTFASCSDSPGINAGHPKTTGDTFVAHGVGTLNGNSGYSIDLIFTDAGEPGRNDTATMMIRDPGGVIVLDVSGNLNNGNHQAHSCQGESAPPAPPAVEPKKGKG